MTILSLCWQPPLRVAEGPLHELSEREGGPLIPLESPLAHLSSVRVQGGRGSDSLRQEARARRVLCSRAKTVIDGAGRLGGHGPDHQTFRVPAFMSSVATDAPRRARTRAQVRATKRKSQCPRRQLVVKVLRNVFWKRFPVKSLHTYAHGLVLQGFDSVDALGRASINDLQGCGLAKGHALQVFARIHPDGSSSSDGSTSGSSSPDLSLDDDEQ